MELRQLRYFVALAEHRHFGKAAETVRIAQPSLSQQIKVLEKDLGVTLFERSKRHVALTADGAALLPYARRILALSDDARAELADRHGLQRGSIRLGVTPTLGGYLLPKMLGQFYEAYPGLDLTISEGGSDELVRELEEGRIDLALLVDHEGTDRENFEFLLKEKILVGIPADHPLAKRPAIDLIELKDEGFILCREGYHLRELTLTACDTVGFKPRIAVSGTDVATALRFVQAGLGVTLLPEIVARSAREVATLALSEPALYRFVGIASNPRRYMSRAARALRNFLHGTCQEMGVSS